MICAIFVGATALYVFNRNANSGKDAAATTSAQAVSMDKGVQYIDIAANGGYRPRSVNAKAKTPTVIRIKTNGTFDCSASVVIPALNFQTLLESTDVAEVTVPAEKAVGNLKGLCSMGMYSFTVAFE